MVLAVGSVVGALQVRDAQVNAEYRNSLAAAWKEGLPTTVEQFETLLPKVADKDNAAPYYAQLKRVTLPKAYDGRTERAIFWNPSPADIATAKTALSVYAREIALVRKATKLPGCRFDRKWEDGAAVLLPEFAQMKAVAKMLTIRGALIAETDPAGAIAETRTIRKMADHARQEPLEISQLVGTSLDRIALLALARWAFRYPQIPEYRQEIARIVDELPEPDLKKHHANCLVEVLSLVDICETREGFVKLGLKEDDIRELRGPMSIVPTLQPKAIGKARIVNGMRMRWEGLRKPLEELSASQKNADSEVDQGLLSFPIAANLYHKLSGGSEGADADSIRSVRADRIKYTAFVRAMAGGRPAKTIETKDLLSPYDGKPIDYSFDGKQIVIDARGSSLTMPPKAWKP